MEDPKDTLIVGGSIEAKSFNSSVMSAGTIQVGGDISDVKGNTMRASGDMTIKTGTITTESKTDTKQVTPTPKPTQAPAPTKDGGCILNVSIGTNPFTENYVDVSCTYQGKTYTGSSYFDEIIINDSELATELYNEVKTLPIN